MGSAFIKREIVFRNFVPRQLLVTWGFPTLSIRIGSFADTTQTCQPSQFIKILKTASCQCIF